VALSIILRKSLRDIKMGQGSLKHAAVAITGCLSIPQKFTHCKHNETGGCMWAQSLSSAIPPRDTFNSTQHRTKNKPGMPSLDPTDTGPKQ